MCRVHSAGLQACPRVSKAGRQACVTGRALSTQVNFDASRRGFAASTVTRYRRSGVSPYRGESHHEDGCGSGIGLWTHSSWDPELRIVDSVQGAYGPHARRATANRFSMGDRRLRFLSDCRCHSSRVSWPGAICIDEARRTPVATGLAPGVSSGIRGPNLQFGGDRADVADVARFLMAGVPGGTGWELAATLILSASVVGGCFALGAWRGLMAAALPESPPSILG